MSRTVIAPARRSLGTVGAMLPVLPDAGVTAEMQRAAAFRLEAAGYRTAWSNELVGKDVFTQAAIVLAATERLTFGTCIANLWVRPGQTASAAADQLADAFPGRFVLGLGVGYPQQAESVGLAFGKPLATVRSYLGAMADTPAYPRILAAMGPKMLALAGEVADGALPAGVGPEFTAAARTSLGPDKLLVVYLGVDDTPDFAAAAAAHRLAGADHVIAGSGFGADFATHIDRLLELAPALTGLS